GAQTVYVKFLRPTLLTYQGDIDTGINRFGRKAEIYIKEAVNASSSVE
ncbi:14800_t:CDS:1, partial [Acaulospora colombiana]